MSTSDILNEMRVNIQKAYLKAEEKGATMPEQKNLQNLEATIESISGGGGGGGSTEWQPNEDMKWAKSVCENDVQDGYTYKVLQMISDGYVYTDIVVPSGGAVKTSDGHYYTENTKHYWNDTNSRVATSHSNMKLRWLIYYYTSETPSITLLQDVMYACFDGVKFGNTFSDKKILEYFDIINGADLSSSVTNMGSMFSNCYSLQSIPQLDTSSVTRMDSMFSRCYSLQSIPQLDTSSVTEMAYMFNGCYSLQSIPQLDTSSVTEMAYMFNGCYSLQTIPQLDTSSVTDMYGMFQSCNSLQSIPQLDTSSVTDMYGMFQSCNSLQSIPQLDTSSVTSMYSMFDSCYSLQSIPLLDTSSVTDMYGMFYDCSSLQSIPQLDTSSVTEMGYMFGSCYFLEFLEMTNIKLSFSISDSTKFSQQTLENLIDNLVDLTGQTAQTFTMGSTNLEKVSQEKKDLAVAKNWSLA